MTPLAATALAALASPSVDVDVGGLLSLRPGVEADVDARVWRLVVGTRLVVRHDPYGAATHLGTFERGRNLHLDLMPGIGAQARLGRAERFDLFGAVYAGPELVVIDEVLTAGDVTAGYRNTALVPKAGVRLGGRARVSDRVGLFAATWLPLRRGSGDWVVEFAGGLGLTARLGPLPP